MKEKISYSTLAIDSMRRASKIAQKKATENGLKVPIWKDGKIIYLESKET
jgi:hypothetical protein